MVAIEKTTIIIIINNDVKWILFVCGYLSIAVSLSLSSACTPSFVLVINEANILLWQTVVTLIWSSTATMRRPLKEIDSCYCSDDCCVWYIVMIVMIVVRP